MSTHEKAADFFFTKTDLSDEYEGVITKMTNAKRQSTLKTNSLKNYITKWNEKKFDEILQIEKEMVWTKVLAEVDTIRRFMQSMETYYDQIITIADKCSNSQGLGVTELRGKYDQLGKEIDEKRMETLEAMETNIDSIIED